MRAGAALLLIAGLLDTVGAAGHVRVIRNARLPAPRRVDVDMGAAATSTGPVALETPLEPTLPGFTVIRATNFRGAVPQPFAATVAEPCAAKSGSTVLVTGNVFAAVSTDSGASF